MPPRRKTTIGRKARREIKRKLKEPSTLQRLKSVFFRSKLDKMRTDWKRAGFDNADSMIVSAGRVEDNHPKALALFRRGKIKESEILIYSEKLKEERIFKEFFEEGSMKRKKSPKREFRETAVLAGPKLPDNKRDIDRTIKGLRNIVNEMGEERIKTKAGFVKVPKQVVIPKQEILKSLREQRLYVKGIEEFMTEQMTYVGIMNLMAVLRKEKEARQQGSFRFKIRNKSYQNSSHYMLYLEDRKTQYTADKVGSDAKSRARLANVNQEFANAKTSIHDIDGKKVMIINNIQLRVDLQKLSAGEKRHYQNWAQLLYDEIEQDARMKGFDAIIFRTSASKKLESETFIYGTKQIENIYNVLPRANGFALSTLKKPIFTGALERESVFWRKEL